MVDLAAIVQGVLRVLGILLFLVFILLRRGVLAFTDMFVPLLHGAFKHRRRCRQIDILDDRLLELDGLQGLDVEL